MISYFNKLLVVQFLRRGVQHFPVLFWLCLLLIITAQLLEGLGIGLFLPLFALLGNGGGEPETALGRMVFWLLEAVGAPIKLETMLIFIVAVFSLKAVIQFAGTAITATMSIRFLTEKREELFNTTLDARYAFLAERKVGHFSNVMGRETQMAAGAILNALAFLAESLSILTYLLCASLINWQITAVGLLLAVVGYAILYPIVNAGQALAQRRTDAENELQSLVYESLSSIRSIKGMAREQPFRSRMGAFNRIIFSSELRRSLQSAFLVGTSEPAAIAVVCAILYFGASGSIAASGAFLVMIGLIYRTLRRLSVLPKQMHSLRSQVPSYNILETWLREARESRELETEGVRVGRFESLTFEGVSFAYGEEAVLKSLDLQIERGQMVAVVGPSGAGKTTLVGLVMGLLRGYEGRLRVNEQAEMAELDPSGWRRRIGYVSQEIQLFNGTVAQNIAFFEDIPHEKIVAAAEKAYCTEFIDQMPDGYQTLVGDRGTRLSGGQRQRLAMARALVAEPELLILDEATSDLDSESEARIQQSIEALQGQVTILAIAHRLSTIRDADRIYVIADGRNAEEGTCEALLERNGAFARLYERQLQ